MTKLESLLSQTPSGCETHLGKTLAKTVDLLQKANLEFALAGAVALGVRCNARYTVDIDFLINPENQPECKNLFKQEGFVTKIDDEFMATYQDVETNVDVDLMFGGFDPEESARVDTTQEKVFNVTVPVVKSEYLLWMYLLSGREKHHVDGLEILRREKVDVKKLKKFLTYDGDQDSIRKLERWEKQAQKEKKMSYSESQRKKEVSL
jgi:hypothetical protein